ncbi:MAG: protein kinase [Myxococcota bacterium]
MSTSRGKIDEPLPAELGEVLGGYRLESVLGLGGMGCVYVASHVRLGRKAAIKVLRGSLAADQAYVSRFFDEARVVNAIRHPNIIDIFDFIETEQPLRVACIMELVEGPTLRACLQKSALSLEQATNMGLQLTSALEAVHRVGVVHRDLKPDNVLMCGDLDGDFSPIPSIKILDFGIAKVRMSGDAGRTTPGLVLGTPAYMPPEQIGGQEVSAASDIYSMGILYYEAIAGRRLFTGEPTGILRRKLLGEVAELVLPEGTPAQDEIRALVQSCLATDPKDRPNLAEARSALETILVIADEAQDQHAAETRVASLKPRPRTAEEPPPGPARSRASLPPFVAPGARSGPASSGPSLLSDPPETRIAELVPARPSDDARPVWPPPDDGIPLATPRGRGKTPAAAALSEPMGLQGHPETSRTPVLDPPTPTGPVVMPRTTRGMTFLVVGAAVLVVLSFVYLLSTRESTRIEIPVHPSEVSASPAPAQSAAPAVSAPAASPSPTAPAAPVVSAPAASPSPSASARPNPAADPAPSPSSTSKPKVKRVAPLPKDDIAPW